MEINAGEIRLEHLGVLWSEFWFFFGSEENFCCWIFNYLLMGDLNVVLGFGEESLGDFGWGENVLKGDDRNWVVLRMFMEGESLFFGDFLSLDWLFIKHSKFWWWNSEI